jgi:hypothetical protein
VDFTQPRIGQVTVFVTYSSSRNRFTDKRPQILEALAKAWPTLNEENRHISLSSSDQGLEANIGPDYVRFRAQGIESSSSLVDVLGSHLPAQLWSLLAVEKFHSVRCQCLVLCAQANYDTVLSELLAILPRNVSTVAGGPAVDLCFSLVFDQNGDRRILSFTPLSAPQLREDYTMLKELPQSALHIMSSVTQSGTVVSRLSRLVEESISFAQVEGIALAKALLGEEANL